MPVKEFEIPRIISRIRRDWAVSDNSLPKLLECLHPCEFPKRSLLVKAGERCRSAYFIESGITRSYWLVDGEEITTSFSEEGGIVFSMDEMYYNRVSEEFVETLEPVKAYRIAIEDIQRLWSTEMDWANWGRVIHQNEYRRLHRSHKERLTLPAKERYEEFCKQFPQVIQRANLAYIASYLGITPATLSRLRASVKDKN